MPTMRTRSPCSLNVSPSTTLSDRFPADRRRRTRRVIRCEDDRWRRDKDQQGQTGEANAHDARIIAPPGAACRCPIFETASGGDEAAHFHVQSRTSGMSFPYLVMYALCSSLT